MIKTKYNVYLLKSEVSQKTYVGYTVDVKTRLRRHNGELANGAKKTRIGRPWKVLLHVSGFEYEKTALQYEFCIQQQVKRYNKKYRKRATLINVMKIMKTLMTGKQICSTALPNREIKYVIYFSNEEIANLWKEL